MWFAIKIGVFYGAPIVALLLAIAWFAHLLIRVRRGVLSRTKAAALYLVTLLLPFAALFAVWATAQLASYFSVISGRYVWDSAEALQFLISLLPLIVYVGVPIAVLVVLFWSALAISKKR